MITNSRLRTFVQARPGDETVISQIRKNVISLWETMSGLLWDAREDHLELRHLPRSRSFIELGMVKISAVTLVRTRNPRQSATWTEIPSTDYFLSERNLHRISQEWCNQVEITYDGGYTEAPEDVQHALEVQAKFSVERVSGERLILKSQVITSGPGQSTGNYMESAFIHPVFKSTVDLYRRKTV